MNFPREMTADDYLQLVLNQYKPTVQHSNSVLNAGNELFEHIRKWAGHYLIKGSFSGSFAKGTAIKSSSDIDIFISLLNDGTKIGAPQLF